MSRSSDSDARRRLFFSTERDLYFLTYTISLILRETETQSGGLVDPEKLPLLVPFVSDARLVEVVNRKSSHLQISLDDRTLVQRSETRARELRPIVHRLVFALVRRGLVRAVGNSPRSAELLLSEQSPLRQLSENDVFAYERSNLRRLRKLVRLRTIGSASLRERLFSFGMEH